MEVADPGAAFFRVQHLCERFPKYHRLALERLTQWSVPPSFLVVVNSWYPGAP
jgi:hypothetical protein